MVIELEMASDEVCVCRKLKNEKKIDKGSVALYL